MSEKISISERCPKCGASIHWRNRGGYVATWGCMSGLTIDGDLLQSKECRISELEAAMKVGRRILDDLDAIRQEEMTEVVVYNPNSNFLIPEQVIGVTAPWTNGKRRWFAGDSLEECLARAREEFERRKE